MSVIPHLGLRLLNLAYGLTLYKIDFNQENAAKFDITHGFKYQYDMNYLKFIQAAFLLRIKSENVVMKFVFNTNPLLNQYHLN